MYAARSLALAMRERLVQRRNLAGTLLVAADDVAVEYLNDLAPGWRELGSPGAAAQGSAWLRSRRTALLAVLSAVVPRERHFLVNPTHPMPDASPWAPPRRWRGILGCSAFWRHERGGIDRPGFILLAAAAMDDPLHTMADERCLATEMTEAEDRPRRAAIDPWAGQRGDMA